MKTKSSIAVVAAFLLTGGTAFAGDGEHGPRAGMLGAGGPPLMRGLADPDRMIERMSRRLDLDETQEQEVRNILLAAEPEFTALRERATANRDALAALDSDEADYDAELQNLAAEKGQLTTEMVLLASQLRADIRSTLTPEQQQQMAEAMSRRRDRAAHRQR